MNRYFLRIGRAVLVLALGLLTLSYSSAMATKLRVIHIPGAPVYKTPAVARQPLIILPLNTPLDAELKQGEYWKVTVEVDGVKTTGYVHEMLVEVVNESDLREEAPLGSVRTQAELTVEIEHAIEENKNLITQQGDLAQTVENLRSLLPKVLNLEDPQKQKQFACEVYHWTGYALARMEEDARAIREFRNMFETDFLAAKQLTKYQAEANISRLIAIAEKQYNGTFVGYVVRIDTEPKEAALKVDGREAGLTPAVVKTQNTRVNVEIEKAGYKPEKFVLALKEDDTNKRYVLTSLGRNLRVSSDPAGAAVFLDGKDTGKTTDCELATVPYGPHKLGLKMDRYLDWEEEFTVPEGLEVLAKSADLTVKTYLPGLVWGAPDGKTFVSPKAMAIDKGGNFYVVDDGPFKVRKYGPDRRADISWGTEGKYFRSLKMPAGIAVDAEGGCYITDARDGTVSKFDKAGQFVRKWGDQGVKDKMLSQPHGIAVDAANDVYVVDAGNSRIVRYSAGTGVVKKMWGKAGPEPGQFNNPTGIAINNRNEVIVVDAVRVQKFTPDGQLIEAFGKLGAGDGEIKQALGVCCDKDDNIFVADGGNNRVQKFTTHGRFIGSFGGLGPGAGQMKTPIAAAVDSKGTVFILERDNSRMQAFEPPRSN
jgi:DNA-binding beta-propeller fold protein YncE